MNVTIPLAMTLAAFAVQTGLLWRLKPGRLAGDEAEYVGAPLPWAGEGMWVRVPLFGALVRLALILSGGRVGGARLVLSALAALTVGAVTWELQRRAGPVAALAGGFVLLASLERAMLSIHLWPDTAMGLSWLVAATVLISPGPQAPIWLALIGTVALGLRIEGAALWAIGLAGVALLPGPWTGARAASAGLALLAPALFTLWNGLGKGVWRLDTTIRFNAVVAVQDAATGAGRVTDAIRLAVAQHTATAPPVRFPPHRILVRGLARLRLLLGPEAFVTQILIADGRAGYRDGASVLHKPVRRFLLRWGFTLLVAAALPVLPFAPAPCVLSLAAATAIYAALVTRSRYRMALLPLTTLCMVLGWDRFLSRPELAELVPGLALLGVFIVLLVLAPRLNEH